MWDILNCFEAAQLFFVITTLIFGVVLLLFIHRVHRLKAKMSHMIELITSKNKEVDTLKVASQNILSPFIPETSKSIIISIDSDGCIIDTNEYALEIFGYTKDELIGQNAFETIFPPQTNASLHNNLIKRIFANPKLYVEYETENIKKSGEHFWISWTNRVIYDDNGKAIEVRSVGFDITKRKHLEEELKYLASVDPLTGVLNRQSFIETAQHELKRAIRYNRDLSVLIIRLDYFKSPVAHPNFSDEILRQIIGVIRSSVRDSDCIGRIGDVEFAILLPETSAKNTKTIEARILKKIQEDNLKEREDLYLTAFFGIAEINSEEETVDSLILRALKQAQTKPTLQKRKKSKGA